MISLLRDEFIRSENLRRSLFKYIQERLSVKVVVFQEIEKICRIERDIRGYIRRDYFDKCSVFEIRIAYFSVC